MSLVKFIPDPRFDDYREVFKDNENDNASRHLPDSTASSKPAAVASPIVISPFSRRKSNVLIRKLLFVSRQNGGEFASRSSNTERSGASILSISTPCRPTDAS